MWGNQDTCNCHECVDLGPRYHSQELLYWLSPAQKRLDIRTQVTMTPGHAVPGCPIRAWGSAARSGPLQDAHLFVEVRVGR